MLYDFDTVISRTNTNSLKWDVAKQELPMWVADMDFQTAPEIRAALIQQAEHGIYGYNIVPEAWYTSVQSWWRKRHHFEMEQEWLIFCTGVVPALSSIIRKLTTVGENILVQTPVYNIFFHSIRNNGRILLENPLLYDGNGYSIDFADLEEKLALPQTTMLLLCNPHNPIGKIWDAKTLAQIGHLAAKYHVLVVSDEIHCDLTDPGREYVPFASVNEECRNNSITCISPTKAFNLAGIQTAAVCIPNPVLRHKADRAFNTDEIAEPNTFAIPAAIAAYTKGEPWLNALREYLFENKKTVETFLREHIPFIKPVPSEATYLLWLDCGSICEDAKDLQAFLREETGLYLSKGSLYGKTGAPFLRLNIACPRTLLTDGLNRLYQGSTKYRDQVSTLKI